MGFRLPAQNLLTGLCRLVVVCAQILPDRCPMIAKMSLSLSIVAIAGLFDPTPARAIGRCQPHMSTDLQDEDDMFYCQGTTGTGTFEGPTASGADAGRDGGVDGGNAGCGEFICRPKIQGCKHGEIIRCSNRCHSYEDICA